MSRNLESIHEIAFEAVFGMIVATCWYLALFGLAYFLEWLLPPFELTLLLISAYGVKYILMILDIWLFLNTIYTETVITNRHINEYRKASL